MNERAIKLIEESFLKPLLSKPSITDISFNGKTLFYQDNYLGHRKYPREVKLDVVADFLKQLANFSEQLFSFSHPLLDISIGRYRINAVHYAIARKDYEKVMTFSLRIGSNKNRIPDDDSFIPKRLLSLIRAILESKLSIVISGRTGSGKTEFQKFLVSSLPANSRVVVIDNILELDNMESENSLDLTIWQVNENLEASSFQNLVRNALRSNPDWLVIAESRGVEMTDTLNSAMTGHPLITTIHSLDAKSIPSRMARMVLLKDSNQKYSDILFDIKKHFRFYVYLEKEENVSHLISRRVKEFVEVDENGNLNEIYSYNNGRPIYRNLSEYTLNSLQNSAFSRKCLNEYLGKKDE